MEVGIQNPHMKCVTTYLPNHIASKTDGAQTVKKKKLPGITLSHGKKLLRLGVFAINTPQFQIV